MKEKWISGSIDKEIRLKDNELHIWKVRISEQLRNIRDYYDLLSDKEKMCASSFHFMEDKDRYIISRAVLKRILARYLTTVTSKKIIFEQNNKGKLYIPEHINNKGIKFNISHSNDYVVYAITMNGNIGIDIEYVNKAYNIENLIRNCCTKNEQSELQKLDNYHKYKYFYTLWVVKEALVKAMGLGLSFDLKLLNVFSSKKQFINKIRAINSSQFAWHINVFNGFRGYCSAFATDKYIKKTLLLSF